MLKKILAKLVGLEGWPKSKPKAETGQEKFNRTEADTKRFAEENRQANLRRMAEQGQGKKETEVKKKEVDLTEELK